MNNWILFQIIESNLYGKEMTFDTENLSNKKEATKCKRQFYLYFYLLTPI